MKSRKITQDNTIATKLASDVEGRGLGLECSPDVTLSKEHDPVPNNIGEPGSGRGSSPCVEPVLETETSNGPNNKKEVVATTPGFAPPPPSHLNNSNSDEQHYSLRWNDFQASMLTSFRHLRDQEDFVDVTLACEGRSFTAHKVVLSACSSYFRHLLKANPCQHPIVILRDVLWRDMEALLQFMYHGEVSVSQEQLTGVLHAARTLQIKGLADLPGKQFSKQASEYSGSASSRASSPGRRGRSSPSPSRKRPRVEIHEFSHNGGDAPPALTSLKGGNAGEEDKAVDGVVDGHSILGQALEGRSPSLMAHLLATRSQLEVTSHYGNAGNHEHSSTGHHEEAGSDSEDSEASDRERSDVNDFPKSESGDYGEEGYGHVNDRQLPPELLPPPGYSHPLLNLQGLHSLFPGPSGLQNSGQELSHARRSLDLMRIRATDPRPCPQCGKIYRSAHTLRTHLEDKHTVCPGYRCVLCGTVAKSRNSLHSHMSRQHRGISTKDLPVLPMPSPFDPVLASCLLAKAGVKVSPAELAARASPTSGNPRGRTADLRLELKSPGIPPTPTVGGLQSHRSSLALSEDVSSFEEYNAHRMMRRLERDRDERERDREPDRDRDRHRDRERERERERSRSVERNLHPYGPSSVINMASSSQRGPKSSKTMQNLTHTVAGENWMEQGGGGGVPPHLPAAANAAMAAAAAAAGSGTGSALLDTYLQLIAEHSAAAAAAAAAANQGNVGHPSRRMKSSEEKMDYQNENEGGRDRERRSPARAESGR